MRLTDIYRHRAEDCAFWGTLPQDGGKSIEQINDGFQRLARSINDRGKLIGEVERVNRFLSFWSNFVIAVCLVSSAIAAWRWIGA